MTAGNTPADLSVIHENSPNACATDLNCATIVLLRVQPSRVSPTFHSIHLRKGAEKSAIQVRGG
jgi:hypothetical protein